MNTCIIAPSYIDTDERMEFASKSFNNLRTVQQRYKFTILVNDESPFEWKSKVQSVYAGDNVEVIHGTDQTGSAAALLRLTNHALNEGFKFGYIHLDDHVYNELFEKLISASESFMSFNKDVKWLRFSGYPIIGNTKKPVWDITDNNVKFCGLEFGKTVFENNNFWTSSVSESFKVSDESFWTIALWHCLYDLEFLRDILTISLKPSLNKDYLKLFLRRRKIHLAHAELFFRSKRYYEALLNKHPGSRFGYCNFQFVGFEMHRNSNWKALMGGQNDKI